MDDHKKTQEKVICLLKNPSPKFINCKSKKRLRKKPIYSILCRLGTPTDVSCGCNYPHVVSKLPPALCQTVPCR